jgi:hypothetical protein
MCDCSVCTDHRRWMAAINPQTEEAKAALDEIMGNLAQAERAHAYAQAKETRASKLRGRQREAGVG